jgi:formamidopyrimidine-DNA glycosylase
LWLDNEHAVVFEPRMTGLVLLADPPSQQHLRLRIDLRGTGVPHLWYWDRRGLGSVRLLSRDEVQQQLGPPRLGPDALGLDADQLRQIFSRRRCAIKVALLDQSAMAGVGNLYASEILHVARVNPYKSCHRLTRCEWQRLAHSMLEVLEEAIRYEGSTLSDGTYRTALNNAGSYQNQHRVYDRAGQPCPNCKDREIKRVVQAQRSTFYCPFCQPQ